MNNQSNQPITSPNSVSTLIRERQSKMASLFPKYAWRVLSWSIFALILSTITQAGVKIFSVIPFSSFWQSSQFWLALGTEFQKTFFFDGFTIGTIISFILTLFANLMAWAFLFWSISFIPFIAFNSYWISQKTKTDVASRQLNWISLYSATILPMAIFALAWNSAAEKSAQVLFRVQSLDEIVILAVATFSIFVFLIILGWIAQKWVTVWLTLFSCMTYAALFLAYGQGYSIASFAMLFGILFYLMFPINQLEKIGLKIIFYDIDTDAATKLSAIEKERIALRTNIEKERIKLEGVREETDLKKEEFKVRKNQNNAQNELVQAQLKAERDELLATQLANIQTKKIQFVQEVNQTQIQMLEQKIEMLKSVFDVISKQFHTRLDQEFPKQLEQLKENASALPPQQLYAQLNGLMKQMDPILEDLPANLDELREQFIRATDELEKQTIKLLGPNKPEDENK